MDHSHLTDKKLRLEEVRALPQDDCEEGIFPQPLGGRGHSDTVGHFLGQLLPEVSPFQGPEPLVLDVGLAGREAREFPWIFCQVRWGQQGGNCPSRELSRRQCLAVLAGAEEENWGMAGARAERLGGFGALVQVGPDPRASLLGDLRASADGVRLP